MGSCAETVHDNPNAAPLAGRVLALEHMANVVTTSLHLILGHVLKILS